MTLSSDELKGPAWELRGFDVITPEPDVVVFRPNRSRSRALAGPLVFTSFFFSIFGMAPVIFWLSMLGLLPPASSSSVPTISQNPLFFALISVCALATFAAVIFPLVLLLHDVIWHHLTPITLDRRNDQLLYGGRVLCRLSDIEAVVLRQMIPTESKSPPVYGVAARLSSGRAIPSFGYPGIIVRYALGPQESNIKETVEQIARFIGARFEFRTEQQNYGASKNPRGM